MLSAFIDLAHIGGKVVLFFPPPFFWTVKVLSVVSRDLLESTECLLINRCVNQCEQPLRDFNLPLSKPEVPLY